MQIKALAVSALVAALIAGCGTSAKEEPAAAAAKSEPPKLLTGASAAMLASTCEGCHGDNGVSNGPATPSIAGMSVYYFTEAMGEFAAEDTKTTIMTRIAKGYSEEEIQAMAAYFAKQKPASAKQETKTSLAMKGANIHEEYCSECHADGGKDVSEDAGLLAGQWMPYLRNTLTDYRNGDRLGGKKMLKKLEEVVDAHGEAGIEALVNYYGGQRL
jgi:sulfide dehydrogenase cytochrome subunit